MLGDRKGISLSSTPAPWGNCALTHTSPAKSSLTSSLSPVLASANSDFAGLSGVRRPRSKSAAPPAPHTPGIRRQRRDCCVYRACTRGKTEDAAARAQRRLLELFVIRAAERLGRLIAFSPGEARVYAYIYMYIPIRTRARAHIQASLICEKSRCPGILGISAQTCASAHSCARARERERQRRSHVIPPGLSRRFPRELFNCA